MVKHVYIIVLMLVGYFGARAQTPSVGDITTMTADDYMNLKLPLLSELLDNSRTNPGVSYYDTRKQEEVSMLKSVKRDWLTYIKVSGNYQYGMYNAMNSFLDESSIYVNQYYGKLQNMYSVGATLSLPLLEIFDRKNKIQHQKIRIQQTTFEALRTQDEINMKIIDAYTEAVQYMSLLKASAESVAIANAQYKLTESDFINGKLDAQTLSRQKNIQTQTLRDYELTRAKVNSSILKLELLSKIKILK